MTALGSFAKHLNNLIESGSTSPTKIHEGTGISRSSLNEYLKEERAPTLEQAERIANFLGYKLEQMLTAQALPAPAPRAPAPVEALRLEAIGLILKASPLKLQSVLIALKGAPGAAGKKSKATPG